MKHSGMSSSGNCCTCGFLRCKASARLLAGHTAQQAPRMLPACLAALQAARLGGSQWWLRACTCPSGVQGSVQQVQWLGSSRGRVAGQRRASVRRWALAAPPLCYARRTSPCPYPAAWWRSRCKQYCAVSLLSCTHFSQSHLIACSRISPSQHGGAHDAAAPLGGPLPGPHLQ